MRVESIVHIETHFMGNKLAVDLKVARRRSGLMQQDVAWLLRVDRTLVSKFERGHRTPSGEQVALLSLIYGQGVPELYVNSRPEIIDVLVERIAMMTIDDDGSHRSKNLQVLSAKLRASRRAYGN